MTTTTNPPLDNVSAEKDKDKEKEKGQHAASPKLPTKTQQQGEVDDILAATRADFAEAQRSRTELQNRLDQVGAELEKLRRRSGQSQRRISSLDSERMQLNLRLRDREEELRGKAKLLDVCCCQLVVGTVLVAYAVFADPCCLLGVSRISKMSLRLLIFSLIWPRIARVGYSAKTRNWSIDGWRGWERRLMP